MGKLSIFYGDPEKFLFTKLKELESLTPSQKIESLCILPGFIVLQNLRRKLAFNVKDFTNKVELTTFEDIAIKILKTYTNKEPTILSESVRKQLILDIVEQIKNGDIKVSISTKRFFQKIDFKDPDVLTIFNQELDEYFRSSNSGLDHDKLLEMCNKIESPFWKIRAVEIYEVFQIIHNLLNKELKLIKNDNFLSRSHLITETYQVIDSGEESKWFNLFPRLKNIYVMGITVFDSTTLHLITSMVSKFPDLNVHIFVGKGTKDQLIQRLEHINFDYEYISLIENLSEQSSEYFHWKLFLGENMEDNVFDEAKINFISAPSSYMEIKEISQQIRKLILLEKVQPHEILVLARNIGKYKTYIKNIFETAGIPYSIETRYPLAYSTAYRFLKATVDLLVKIEEEKNISYADIMNPLRLGLCLPKRSLSAKYPLDDKIFLSLEESLDFLEKKLIQQSNTEKLSFEDWKKAIAELPSWLRKIIIEYLNYIKELLEISSNKPSDFVRIINSLIYFFIRNIRKVITHSIEGPGIENKRQQFFQIHPTYQANRLKNKVSNLSAYLDYLLNKNEADIIKWKYVSQALGELIGRETFGIQNFDQNTVCFIDAANVYFRDAEYIFLLGFQTDEFPRKCPDSIFLPLEIKKELERKKSHLVKKDPSYGYIYNLSPENDYASELDFFEQVLFSSKDTLFLSRTYLDREGIRLDWSSFTDNVKEIKKKERKIYPTEIFNILTSTGDFQQNLALLSEKEILQLYNWILHRANNNIFPQITEEEFLDIYAYANLDIQEKEINDRIERYLNPPHRIEAKVNQFYLPNDIFEKIVGDPYRIHELSLIYDCPLRYYFYQFYFNWYKGHEISREIPFYTTKRLHYRFGFYPKLLRKIYLKDEEKNKLLNFIQQEIPERMEIKGIDFEDKIENIFERYSDYYCKKYKPIFENEEKIVINEIEHKITRNWEVENETDIILDNGCVILFPRHRMDSITITKPDGTKNTFYLPVFYNNTSYSLSDNFEGSSFNKFLSGRINDVRIAITQYLYETKMGKPFFGIEFIEPFSGKRRGIYKQYSKTKYSYYKVSEIYPEDILSNPIFIGSWTKKSNFTQKMDDVISSLNERLSDIKKGIFDALKRVNTECVLCDYRRLCSGYSPILTLPTEENGDVDDE